MFKKTFALAFFFSLSLSLFLPVTVWAQDSTVNKNPAFNPVCWKEKECIDTRQKSFGVAAKEGDGGWVQNQGVCPGADWGMCLPAGTSKTAISFGGQKEFSNIGVFIQLIYKYALQIAAIVAVVMIIIAGVQWTTSGGSSERVTSAKKRIAGAIVGLFIAYMSFFILNSVNPATVNLRLPQVYMIKQQSMVSQFCSDAPANTKFALAAEADKQIDDVKLPKDPKFDWVYSNPEQKAMFLCGKRFFPDGTPTTCWGDVCNQKGESNDPVKMCLAELNPITTKYSCQKANIAGFVTMPDSFTGCVVGAVKSVFTGGGSGWTFPYVIKHRELFDGLWVVCGDGNIGAVEGEGGDLQVYERNDKKAQGYVLALVPSQVEERAKEVCKEIKGYGLLFRFNHACITNQDQFHLIGKGGKDLMGWKYLDQKAISNAGKFTLNELDSLVGSINLQKIKQSAVNISPGDLLQLDDLKKGTRVDIDASNVSNNTLF